MYSDKFQPNLEQMSKMSKVTKDKYLEKLHTVNESWDLFNASLQNTLQHYQKVLEDNLELFLENENLKSSIDENKKRDDVQNNKNHQDFDDETNIFNDVLHNCRTENFQDLPRKCSQSSDSDIQILPNVPEREFRLKDNLKTSHLSTPKKSTPLKEIIETENEKSPIIRKKKNWKKTSISHSSSCSTLSGDDGKINTIKSPSALDNFNLENVTFTEDDELFSPPVIKDLEEQADKEKPSSNLVLSNTLFLDTEYGRGGKRVRQTTLKLVKKPQIEDVTKISNVKTSAPHFSQDSDVEIIDKFETKEKEKKQEAEFANENCADLINSTFCPEKKQNKSSLRNRLRLIKKFDNPKENLNNVNPTTSKNIRNNISLSGSSLCKKKEDNFSSNKILEESTKFPTTSKFNNISNEDKNKSSKNPSTETCQNTNLEETRKSDSKDKNEKYENNYSFDETYFSPAHEHEAIDIGNNYLLGSLELEAFLADDMTSPPLKKQALDDSYDRIPDRKEKTPECIYKENPVRKKDEKLKLNGVECEDCCRWYDVMDLSDKERRDMLNKCSKHRSKFNIRTNVNTPASFWNPGLSDSSSSTEE